MHASILQVMLLHSCGLALRGVRRLRIIADVRVTQGAWRGLGRTCIVPVVPRNQVVVDDAAAGLKLRLLLVMLLGQMVRR